MLVSLQTADSTSKQLGHYHLFFLSVGCSCIFFVLVEVFVESEYDVTKVQDIESHFHWLEGWSPW